MQCNKCLSLNCFGTQYSLIFLSLILVTYLSCCIGSFITLSGQLLVLSFFSYKLTKKLRKCRNKEVVTSFKRAVVVTGCDTGFGNALAHELNANGYRVYATVLNPDSDGAKDLVTGARFEGKTKVIRMDVTNDEEVKSVYQQIKDDLQQNEEELWAVVNNAGILALGPIDWGSIDTFKDVINVNTFGTVRVSRTFLPLIRKSKGRIVNLVSLAGRFTAVNMGIYSMSKHAVIAFSDALRRENAKQGIKVSTVEPFAYKTPMASEEYFSRCIDKQWSESSDEVREFYGEDFKKKLKDMREKGNVMFPPGEDIYEVVNKLVEAVRSPEPEVRYPVIPKKFKLRLFFFIAKFLPIELYDKFTSFRGKFTK